MSEVGLSGELKRWRAAGLLSSEQAQAIEAFERETGGPEPRDQDRLTLVEAFAYLGAIVALAGIAILLVTHYSELGTIGRLGILGLVTGLAVLAAVLLGRTGGGGAVRRARAAALGLFVVGVTALFFQGQVEALGGQLESISRQDGTRIWLVSAVAGSLLAAGLLVRTDAGLLAALLAIGTYMSGASFLSQVFTSPLASVDPWIGEAVFATCGAILVVGAELSRRGHRRWSTEILAFAAFLIPPLAAYTSPPDLVVLELVGGLIAGLAFAAAVLRSSAGYAIAGAVGVFGFVLELELKHFQNSLGFALILITSGLALLAISYLTARLIPRLRMR